MGELYFAHSLSVTKLVSAESTERIPVELKVISRASINLNRRNQTIRLILKTYQKTGINTLVERKPKLQNDFISPNKPIAAIPPIDPAICAKVLDSISGIPQSVIPNSQPTDWANPKPPIPKQKWHQLAIIGNGFDLECGLPSSFSDFVSDRKSKLTFLLNSPEAGQRDDVPTPTVWDVILEHADHFSWCDIEGAVADWVVPNKDKHGAVLYYRPFEVLACLKGQNTQRSIQKLNDPEKEVAGYIIRRVGKEATGWEVPSLLSYFRRELSTLEHDFGKYLSHAVEKTKDYKNKAQELIFTLLNEERPDERVFSIEESVLSFNYTRVAHRLNTHDHDISYVNVHGRLGGEIVFGIDGTGLLPDVDISPFTKTYRLMSLDLPDTASLVQDTSGVYHNDGTALIKFYGHSLGKADYSYFQAIFDAVRLYESSTRLIFYFRPYGDFDETAARNEMIDKAINLLSAYGETLDNKDHGKNLIHKLLIEGRLSVSLLPYGTVRRAQTTPLES